MALPAGIQAILCDLDGVLYVGDAPVPGAPAAVQRLRDRGLALRFLTNTTTRPRQAVADKLAALGFDVALDEILTAPQAAVAYLRRAGRTGCHLVMRETLKAEFAGLEATGDEVDAVVIARHRRLRGRAGIRDGADRDRVRQAAGGVLPRGAG